MGPSIFPRLILRGYSKMINSNFVDVGIESSTYFSEIFQVDILTDSNNTFLFMSSPKELTHCADSLTTFSFRCIHVRWVSRGGSRIFEKGGPS